MIWVLVIVRLTVESLPPIVIPYASIDDCNMGLSRVQNEMALRGADASKYRVFCVEPYGGEK